jgi:hypothetical protein
MMGEENPPPPACTTVEDQVLASDGSLLDAIVVDGEPVALVRTASGAAIIQGGVATPIAVNANEGTLARDATKIVAILRDNTARKTYAASGPDFAPVDTGLDDGLSKPHLAYWNRVCTTSAGCVSTDSLTLFFEGGFSSASAAHRSGETWSEEELYMSSVSWIQDTANLDGDVVACVRYSGSAILLGHHPYRGDLDDLAGWSASGAGCALATQGRDVAMVLGSSPPRLARWTVPLMPAGPWAEPPPATDLPLTTGTLYDLANESGTLVLAYADAANALHIASERGGTWTEEAAPALTTSRAPILHSDAKARHLFVDAADGVHYARTCFAP